MRFGCFLGTPFEVENGRKGTGARHTWLKWHMLMLMYKKDVIGSAWDEHDKLKITEEQLKTWHESIDQS
jgi:hypothetical protein